MSTADPGAGSPTFSGDADVNVEEVESNGDVGSDTNAPIVKAPTLIPKRNVSGRYRGVIGAWELGLGAGRVRQGRA